MLDLLAQVVPGSNDLSCTQMTLWRIFLKITPSLQVATVREMYFRSFMRYLARGLVTNELDCHPTLHRYCISRRDRNDGC